MRCTNPYGANRLVSPLRRLAAHAMRSFNALHAYSPMTPYKYRAQRLVSALRRLALHPCSALNFL